MSERITSLPPADDLSWLKDFQRETVDYAFHRFYLDRRPTDRFLVADEVGLGKTLVARGLVSRVVDHLRNAGRRRVDIVYICSNQAIARQNVQKLGPWATESTRSVDRITMLPVQDHEVASEGVNLLALTPGTSFSRGQQPGKFEERALLYALLEHVWGRDAVRYAGTKRVFYLRISDDAEAPRRLLRQKNEYQTRLDEGFLREFARELDNRDEARQRDRRPSLREEADILSSAFKRRRPAWPYELRSRRNAFIGELREALATVAITRLRPDLIILDEFQRFRDLLQSETHTWATRLARRLFQGTAQGDRATKSLLLSATPYPMYTIADDTEGEDHYQEFIQVCRFLFDDDGEAERLQEELDSLRVAILQLDADGGAAARQACIAVANRLRRVMVRTERLSSSGDRNGMLTSAPGPRTELRPEDVRGYLAASEVASDLDQPDIMEYWKASPYILNFMEQYAFKHAIEDARTNGRPIPALERAVRSGQGLLPWGDLQRYHQLEPPNVKLRAFLADLERFKPWRLLWLPPALPYYQTGSLFDSHQARSFTKRLVFSSWVVVPKVIASLVSYEAERYVTGESGNDGPHYSTPLRDRPGYLLNFKLDEGRPAAMTSFAFVYPSPVLSNLGDPLAIVRELDARGSPAPAESVLELARERIMSALQPHLEASEQHGQPDQRWYWAAPLLLDALDDESGLRAWFDQSGSAAWTGADQPDSGFERHLREARDWLTGERSLGRPPSDLADTLAELAVGGPANCALRALRGASNGTFALNDPLLRSGSARIAWAFRTLLNSPIETVIVRGWRAGTAPFWREALHYCIDGNLQAVLDEYAHALRDWLGFVQQTNGAMIEGLAAAAAQAISLRTVNYRVDIPRLNHNTVELDPASMRGRFAVRLSGGRTDEQDEVRVDHVRHAFNSPFWPFVLATTSIGQEGLDFHLYCHAVVHWNLPRNPVDLEQREGRVHRFKGHAIRKNVANSYGTAALADGSHNVWDRLFEAAEADRAPTDGDLVPYWVFRPTGDGAAIERYTPLLPLSREAGQLQALLRSVVTYRLAFGQPRQDDLVAWLGNRLSTQDPDLFEDLRVDLSPPRGG